MSPHHGSWHAACWPETQQCQLALQPHLAHAAVYGTWTDEYWPALPTEVNINTGQKIIQLYIRRQPTKEILQATWSVIVSAETARATVSLYHFKNSTLVCSLPARSKTFQRGARHVSRVQLKSTNERLYYIIDKVWLCNFNVWYELLLWAITD